jgi:hypothetical protein
MQKNNVVASSGVLTLIYQNQTFVKADQRSAITD